MKKCGTRPSCSYRILKVVQTGETNSEKKEVMFKIFHRGQDNDNWNISQRPRQCQFPFEGASSPLPGLEVRLQNISILLYFRRLGLKIFQYFYIFGGWAWEYFNTSLFLWSGLRIFQISNFNIYSPLYKVWSSKWAGSEQEGDRVSAGVIQSMFNFGTLEMCTLYY